MTEKYIGKGIAVLGLALICSVQLYLTKGESGIGWFIIGLLIIW